MTIQLSTIKTSNIGVKPPLIGACYTTMESFFKGLQLCLLNLSNQNPYVGLMNLQNNKTFSIAISGISTWESQFIFFTRVNYFEVEISNFKLRMIMLWM
jgi:hypothetical protein